ncbi:MAG: PstS family phosphate ABC transporter substrate-binding protein [Candidatus Omnitrophica bacterium]|nr:PstS family phosphate ABC transporter substrate-binding protein [Candidatus Omnitrophota bacterium]
MRSVIKLGMAVAGVGLLATAASADMLQVKGSDTIINLVQKEAEVYMQQNAGAKISVTGGGSGTGIAALINKKCAIANSSRAINAKEVESATSSGVAPSRIVIAIDGLSVVVNGSNPLNKLTMDQIGKIFRGEIQNWSEVGGSNMPINLYGRQSNSGTYGFFREMVLKGEYSSKMNTMNGNSQIVEAVKADPSGIGYIGVGYAKNASGVTILDVAMGQNGSYKSPLDKAAVEAGQYPIARPLYQYVNGTPTGAIKDFLSFELSEQGQRIVEEEGFYPISAEYKEANAKFGL